MIIEWLVSAFVDLIYFPLTLFSFNCDDLPTNTVSLLRAITSYGVAFVGSDLILIVFSLISTWAAFKIIVGLITYIWKLLPFT